MVAAIRIANLVLLVINVALFCLWFSLIRMDSLPSGGEQAAYVLNQVSVQVTILGIMVAFGAVLLAGLGVFGFQAIADRAASQAERVAKRLVEEKWESMTKISRPLDFSAPPRSVPDVGDAREAQD